MNAAQLLNQDSGDTEKYTPADIIEAARRCMGSIDLDPASNVIANKVVKARRFFTKEDDGLSQRWSGNVWLNHPFSRGEKACKPSCKKKICNDPDYHKYRGYHITQDIPSNGDWVEHLLAQYEAGNVKQALSITFCNTSEVWFQRLATYPQCVLNGRTQYRNMDGSVDNNVTKGSVITYLGDDLDSFYREFSALGKIQIEYGMAKRYFS